MTFLDFNLPAALQNALDDLSLQEPTTIQEKAYPVIMSGRDMVGIAQTGTGKTFAFLVPLLRQWKFSKEKHPTVAIVVPTRELATQVEEEIKKLTVYMKVRSIAVYGGVNMVQQTPLLTEGLDIIVGTPGRMLDFLLNGTLKFRNIKKFIIDEVDEMLNLGFRPQLVRLMEFLPTKRQNLMFSATMTGEIKNFIADYFIDPEEVEAARSGAPLENIKQAAIMVPNFFTKIRLLEFLVHSHPEFAKVLLFVSTKQLADDVFDCLPEDIAAFTGVIHANKSQNFRFEQLRRFNKGDCRILIATDLVARGLDFDDVTHVVNFDIPTEPENYMHRIGRTGRIAKKGVAISFLTPKDVDVRQNIEELMGAKIALMALPDEVELSTEQSTYDQDEVKMKNVLVRLPKKPIGGGAFHEKAAKNQKVNQKVRYTDKMMAKYGKPKTRGMKKK
jgi:ATP-dependent RNA helicase RhlE